MKILFVCTGNTCRSSMAEALFKHHLQLKEGLLEGVEVSSAGTGAWEGDFASSNAVAVMKERGISLSEHRAIALTRKQIEAADLILTMTTVHKERVAAVMPQAANRVFTLKEYAPIEKFTRGSLDIVDPYGQSLETYRRCADEIEAHIQQVIKKLMVL